MGTGACGIDCAVCRLHTMGLCSSCGSGTSLAGERKIAAQRDLFGMACTILECAAEKKIAYCNRDCGDFPCDSYKKGPYPFSEGFLSMQERRREHKHTTCKHDMPGAVKQHWDEIKTLDRSEVCKRTMATPSGKGGYMLKSLCDTWEIDLESTTVKKIKGGNGGEWDRFAPFLSLIYLIRGGENDPSGEMAAPRDVLPGRDFFTGDHSIETHNLEEVFGHDTDLFLKSAEALGGEKSDQGDASALFHIFPKMPALYILWLADDEFPAKVTILLDSQSLHLFPLDATDVALNMLNERLVMVSRDFL